MDILFGGLPVWAFLLACGVSFLAGFVKGSIGFALPLVMIAILPSFMPAQTALAALILPILVTNLLQSLRSGFAEAYASGRKFWRFIAASVAGIAISAPFVVILPQSMMFLLLGGAVLVFSVLQLSGWTPHIPASRRAVFETGTGLIAGLYGGISGVWGPPTLVYLMAIKVEKREMVRVLNVIFMVGAMMLVAAHLRSGVLNAQTIPLSLAMLPPSILGLKLGYIVQDRLDAERFRRYALITLCIIALNLLRRGVVGD